MSEPSMANGVLDAVGKAVTLPVEGKGMCGVSIQGTFVGTVVFEESYDGDTFYPSSLKVWGSTTTANSATATGNWHLENVGTRKKFRARMTAYTSGKAEVTLGAAEGSGFQDAYRVASDKYKTGTSGANAAQTITVAADANKGHRLKKLVVSFSGGTPTTANVKVEDGSGTTIWFLDLELAAKAFDVPLPADGLVGTPNKAMLITVAAGGTSVVSKICAEMGSA